MEPVELISEEWISSLSGMYTDEEADFMNQLIGNCSVPEQLHEYSNSNLGTEQSEPAFCSAHDSTIVSVTKNNICSYFDAQVPNTDFVCFLQGSNSSYDSSNIFPTISGLNHTSNNTVTNFANVSMDFSLGDSKFNPYLIQGNDRNHINENTNEELGLDTGKVVLADQNLQAQKERETLVSDSQLQEYKTRSIEKSGKRSRSSNEVPKNKRKVKSKKSMRSASTNTEEDMSPGSQHQTLSHFCSDDDSNASQEQCGGASSSLSQNDSTALKSCGKSRSSRGTATDPQSLYARRRRERINERLKILQNLVPNGTKVDISTMLEEAVQYVKLLQLQIKLLSSDDLWMYAPIAYNGMNIGLQLSITPTKEPENMHIIS